MRFIVIACVLSSLAQAAPAIKADNPATVVHATRVVRTRIVSRRVVATPPSTTILVSGAIYSEVKKLVEVNATLTLILIVIVRKSKQPHHKSNRFTQRQSRKIATLLEKQFHLLFCLNYSN